MPWDINTARQVIGLAANDPSKDVALKKVMDRVLAEIETKLGRGLLFMRETIRVSVDTNTILLPRYPVWKIYRPDPTDILLHHRVGRIRIPWGTFGGKWFGDDVEIDYEGGFRDLPSDLEAAMWEAFLQAWAGVNDATGLPVVGGGATIVQGSGEISSVTIDGMTIRYDVGASIAGGASSSAQASSEAIWGWLAPWESILSTYRSHSAPSLAMG